MSESPDHSGFRDFSLGFNGDENVLREAFPSALLWFTHNHQRQGLRKRPNQPRCITSRYGWSSRSYRKKDKARGGSRRVPRRRRRYRELRQPEEGPFAIILLRISTKRCVQSFAQASRPVSRFRVGQHEYAGSGALADQKSDLMKSFEDRLFSPNNNNKLRRELGEMRGSR